MNRADRPGILGPGLATRLALASISLTVAVLGTSAPATAQLPPAYQTIVDQTWSASLARRQTVLTSVVNSGSVWPYGIQGQTMWALSALSLNRDVATANAKILASATAAEPYAFFDVYSYLKIATLFGQNSSFVDTRGRITAQTEAAMKKVLWTDVSGTSLAMAALDRVWWVNDSENLDLNKNVTSYLAAALLKDDATYGTRLYTDGKKAVDHYNGWNAWYASWLRERATHGLLVEVGSDTYQKYSLAVITTLRDLSPDPVVQQRAGMMLDLFYIDEAQYSIGDRRGGGKSRNNGTGGSSEFEGYAKLMYGEGGAASHTKVFETSTYQVPAVAALMRVAEVLNGPVEVRTRLPGESQSPSPTGLPSGFYALAPSSRLVNYEYRTPNYALGSTLQDDNLSYAAISSQLRWGGMLFGDLKAVYPEAAQAGGQLSAERLLELPEQVIDGGTEDAEGGVHRRPELLHFERAHEARAGRLDLHHQHQGFSRGEGRQRQLHVDRCHAHHTGQPGIAGDPAGGRHHRLRLVRRLHREDALARGDGGERSGDLRRPGGADRVLHHRHLPAEAQREVSRPQHDVHLQRPLPPQCLRIRHDHGLLRRLADRVRLRRQHGHDLDAGAGRARLQHRLRYDADATPGGLPGTLAGRHGHQDRLRNARARRRQHVQRHHGRAERHAAGGQLRVRQAGPWLHRGLRSDPQRDRQVGPLRHHRNDDRVGQRHPAGAPRHDALEPQCSRPRRSRVGPRRRGADRGRRHARGGLHRRPGECALERQSGGSVGGSHGAVRRAGRRQCRGRCPAGQRIDHEVVDGRDDAYHRHRQRLGHVQRLDRQPDGHARAREAGQRVADARRRQQLHRRHAA